MVSSVTDIKVSKGGHDFTYYDFVGRSTDSKPTTGVFNGATFLEKVVNDSGVFQNKWRIYIFDGQSMTWDPLSEITAPTV